MSATTGSVSAVCWPRQDRRAQSNRPAFRVCGPFDTAQGSYAVAVAELVEVQGSYAVAVAELVEVQGSYFTSGRNFFQVYWI